MKISVFDFLVFKDGGIMSQKEKQISLLQQQKNICEQQQKKLVEEKENLVTEIEEISDAGNQINSKYIEIKTAIADLTTKEAADPE